MPDSPTEDLTVSQEAVGQPDVPAADSSTADAGSQNKTVLDAVQAALDGPEKSPSSETQDSSPDPDVAAEPEKVTPADFSEQEMKRFHPSTQERIRHLVQERGAAYTQLREAEPKIQAHDKIVGFMEQHQLGAADFDNTMNIMAEIRSGDPRRALQMLTPVVQGLIKAAGLELPEDLKTEVDNNTMSEARARELSMARAEKQRREVADAERQKNDQVRQQRQQAERVVSTAVDTVEQWHAEKAKTDPDWNLKQGRVVEIVELELRRDMSKYPKNAKEARALCDDVLKRVEAEMRSILPKPRSVRPSTTSGAAPSHLSAKPKSALEAVNFGLAMTRG